MATLGGLLIDLAQAFFYFFFPQTPLFIIGHLLTSLRSSVLSFMGLQDTPSVTAHAVPRQIVSQVTLIL